MPPINRPTSKECTRTALKGIADFNGDIESFTFAHWHDFHKTVFINLLAACIRKKGSRIVLNENMLDDFANIGELIDHVENKAVYLGEPVPDLKEKGGELQ